MLVLLAAVCILGPGCSRQAQQPRLLRVGIVNLDRILPKLPEYQRYSEQFVSERQHLFRDMGGNPLAIKKYLMNEKNKEALAQSVQKWDDTQRRFVDQVTDEVRTAASAVARDKKIDIVLLNAPWYPVSEQMAVDITTDVILQLHETGKLVD